MTKQHRYQSLLNSLEVPIYRGFSDVGLSIDFCFWFYQVKERQFYLINLNVENK